MTKCLPCTCCQCGVNLSSYEEGRRPLELFCDCLVALCTDCGLQQAIRHITITGSYLECPVCRCKESNHRNGYVCEAQVVYYASLLLRKDTLLRFPYASKSKDEKSLQILASLYLQCGFADGMEGVEGVGSMGLTQLGLFTARCEAHLQRLGYAPDAGAPPAVVGVVSLPLDLGPLESLKLKENLVLVKVLGLLEEQAKEEEGKGKGKQNEAEAKEEEKEEGKGKQDEDQEGKQHQEDEQEEGDALTRLQEELPTICQLCFDDLVPGNTVRGRCHCCSKCCQLCTRRSVKNLREGIKCSLCRAPIPVDTKEAKANQVYANVYLSPL
ncbi:hypothetical protein B484DRAFT_134875 [Ochromonadaceae sp. CCMP2298]|nr:hypothetical protein B484DRAFT_134875 [Ochromonadaceae sp. CCMP2298]